MAESYVATDKTRLRHEITQAYYTEVFARYKKLPKLEKVLKDIGKPSRKTCSKGDMILRAMAKEKGVDV